MEDSNAERASTMPSRSVTVTQVGAPAASARKSLLPVEPWISKSIAIARERDRQHVRLAIGVGYPDVRDAGGVENRVQN